MKLCDFLICDDIRMEVGNKHSLIGVYDDSIQFLVPPNQTGRWPKATKLGFYFRVAIEPSDQVRPDAFSVYYKWEGESESMLAQGKIQEPPKEADPHASVKRINFAVVVGNFVLPKPTTLQFVIRLFKGTDMVCELIPDAELRVTELTPQPFRIPPFQNPSQ